MKSILFVMGGLAIGGVETYVVRLSKYLSQAGYTVTVTLLSSKYDAGLFNELSRYARVNVVEHVPFFAASSWINALLPAKKDPLVYDIVHVVDVLTLAYVFLNKARLKFTFLSIGVYHSMEISWWRERNIYFRKKMLELYDRNVQLTLFPNERTAEMAAAFANVDVGTLDVLPLGISFENYSDRQPLQSSLRIVSVGRLVDFKVYNKHVITQLSGLRKRANFEYFIYGDGPEHAALVSLAQACGVSEYVHFMGEVEYAELPGLFDGAFCFVGSGTTIIEAAAAGVPSVVGIESIELPLTCGLFSDISGYSYNEESATTVRMGILETLEMLHDMSPEQYSDVSVNHRQKAKMFDIVETSKRFVELSNRAPVFDGSMNRWVAMLSFFKSVIVQGPKALKSRFDSVG
ncbi:Glycosyl transferases group 1 [Pseudomonas antarctica]|uniref:GDP-mannose-dependent alpha-(1-6)-phosphatidylinositol monomannoside mannosyltransferase n=1 Tax=Pseudomonas antarctica TaxID=219572 RepID=A0A1H0CS45_9PSED|nr:glycosyltransferase family 4 protein [Pseudomonas antarctica]KAF2406135.1 GDP-mannose-dependent alpha-(1-6)-phosphatidylinositol monomannoside mannosyltransferase [Pseudomonas antarctica]SDN60698.1 Glycosyl transferases group 1 [Pseudomonas antarctica]